METFNEKYILRTEVEENYILKSEMEEMKKQSKNIESVLIKMISHKILSIDDLKKLKEYTVTKHFNNITATCEQWKIIYSEMINCPKIILDYQTIYLYIRYYNDSMCIYLNTNGFTKDNYMYKFKYDKDYELVSLDKYFIFEYSGIKIWLYITKNEDNTFNVEVNYLTF